MDKRLDHRRTAACRGFTGGIQHQHQRTGGDFVADLDLEFFHGAAKRGRNVHRGFVGFDGYQRGVGGDLVANIDHDFDDFDILEAADIGDENFLDCHLLVSLNVDRIRSLGVDAVFPDRFSGFRYRQHAVIGQGFQRGEHDIVAVNLEELAQCFA